MCARANGLRCWDKRKEAKPLRQVHRKVLRNWQVNCAMHAWAMPLGERRAQDLSITTLWSTLAQHFYNVNLITDIAGDDANCRKKEQRKTQNA